MSSVDETDGRLVARAIASARLCTSCIVARTGVPRARVVRLLAMIGTTVKLNHAVAACDGCALAREVFLLT